MKKIVLIAAFALAMFSCNKEEGKAATGLKTAYVDAEKLSKDYEEFKDLISQRSVKEAEMRRELDGLVQKYKLDRAEAENLAPSKGQQWVQVKAEEFMKREKEIGMMQESMARQLQDEYGAKNDSVSSKIKKHIASFGKKNNYDYIYSTADISSIIYAKEGYDITDKVLKELNDSYKSTKKDEPAKEAEKK